MTVAVTTSELLVKQCTGCRVIKPITEFTAQSRSKDGRHTRCALCTRAYANAHYAERRSAYRAGRKRIIARNQAFKEHHLNRNPCVDCGIDEPVVLVFDHVGDAPKKYSISKMVFDGASIKAIEAEIEKCEVRCANCHARRHHIERMMLQEAIAYDGTPWKDD